MIRPVHFAFNEETAVTNAFQVQGNITDVQLKAQKEFDAFVQLLKSEGVNVFVVNDTPLPHTPDSIFPNNWISFHDDGSMVFYPMQASNRRMERKPGVIEWIHANFSVTKTIDLTPYEYQHKYLEGTGSMVLDREKRIAYACLSPRTDKEVCEKFCAIFSYTPVFFHGYDKGGMEIYHTNVMMCVADNYVVICLQAIPDAAERKTVVDTIVASGKQIIEITLEQMNQFAGNMLQVETSEGSKLLVMSTRAFLSLTADQRNALAGFNKIIHASLDVIEVNGGGSARCMMAEVHLPPLRQ